MDTIYKNVAYPGAPGSNPGEGAIRGYQVVSWGSTKRLLGVTVSFSLIGNNMCGSGFGGQVTLNQLVEGSSPSGVIFFSTRHSD